MTQTQPANGSAAIATKLANATDDFIKAHMPDWLLRASPAQIDAVRTCSRAHTASQELLHTASAGIVGPDDFALSRLQSLLRGPLGIEQPLRTLYWREVRRSFRVPPSGLLPDESVRFLHQPALQRLMQNFEVSASFYLGSGLASSDQTPDPVTDQSTLVTDEVSVIALFCHEEDIGQDYQSYLGKTFDPDMQNILAQDKRKALALVAEIALLKKDIEQADLQMLRQQVADVPQPQTTDNAWQVMSFKLLGCRVDGALAFEQRDADDQVQRVVLYLPDAPERTVCAYASWTQLNITLAADLGKPAFAAYLRRRIALKQLPGLLSTLSKRLADPTPDLEAGGEVIATEAFASLATQQVLRIKDDARQLLVPSADVDHAASERRLQEMESVGLVMLNVAGMFIPVVGALLLAQTVVDILSQTYQGVRDWSRGHRHEALEHLLGVAETVAVGVAVAAGAGVVAKGFTRSAFVDGLEPVSDGAGARRLWSDNLEFYAAHDVPEQAVQLDNGLYSDGQRQWWKHENTYYQVRQRQGRWQLSHPQREDAYAPTLQFNGERSWRLHAEHPFEWQGSALLLRRLWPDAHSFDVQQISQILQVAGVDEDELRGLLMENRALPVSLRDTLERFSVEARIDTFFTALETPSSGDADPQFYAWSLSQIDTAGLSIDEQRSEVLFETDRLRELLFKHFSRQYLPADSAQALLQRDFPGLPDAYALHLLEQASDADRLRMTEEQRIPLTLAERARVLLRHARLVRMREGLFLRSAYQADSVDLAFCLLRNHANWPSSINLELDSENGQRLAMLNPQQNSTHVMVWRNGRYVLSDGQGRELDVEIAEPAGLAEVLLAVLPDTERARLKWNTADAAQQIRADLQGWMPKDRTRLERLLGWRELKPWFNPGQRLADGRVGYLLSGRGEGRSRPESMLRSRIRALYAGFNDNEVEAYLNIVLQAPGSPFDLILSQEQEYAQLDASLAAWESDAAQRPRHRARRAVGEELRRCWRLQGERIRDSRGEPQGFRLNLMGAAILELPELPAQTDFNHVTELSLTYLQLQRLPVNFLQNFRGVRSLNLSANSLTELPESVRRLSELRVLRLNNNQIRMTPTLAGTLDSLAQLRVLNLSDNPLGEINLQFRQVSRLNELHLRNCDLESVPSGLVWCGFLEYADLRDNRIAVVPEEIMQAPRSVRRALVLRNNSVPDVTLQRLRAPLPLAARHAAPDMALSRGVWIQDSDPQVQQQRGSSWDRLRAEPGSNDFFQLINELSGTSDFRLVRDDLGRRVWEVLDAAEASSELRQELFSLAGNPRTCVDSVASCFSALEVRVFAARALQESAPEQARAARLDLARRLFRLDRIEQIAREDINAREAEGRGVDEVEVSLAYRSGLARQLRLPGQPASMQFQAIAGVRQSQLDHAEEVVRQAESSDALAVYISQRDFWLDYLRGEYAERFSAVEQPFWDRLEALDDGSDATDGAYLEQSNQLASERQEALNALALQLTKEALAAEPAGTGEG